MKCIVSTRPDGGVSVTHPSQEFMTFLTAGGVPAGYFGRVLDRDYEIEKMIRNGRQETIAVRWVMAMISGGLTDAEAYGLIRDKDTPDDWTAKELWDATDIPLDRWFRNAWRRSQNGGPIVIDIKKARLVQAKRIVARRNALLEEDPLGDIDIDWHVIKREIDWATEPEEIRAVWPAILNSAIHPADEKNGSRNLSGTQRSFCQKPSSPLGVRPL